MIMDWPSSLPRPERQTWQRSLQDGRRKTQGDAGPARYGRKLSRVAQTVTMSMLLTRDLRAVFDRFYEVDCAGGTRLFNMPDPTTDGWPLLGSDGLPLLAADGQPLLLSKLWLCSWGDTPPSETLVGIECRKTFSLQVLP
ncbi:hypothetical protein EGN72_02430 [Pseudorhodobacter sp. E13]|nr:hypothetical protein EGN72_02430 [Pseudorhodobacter sp. E13]